MSQQTAEPVTMHGLNRWHEYIFEKFGWMTLAFNHGNIEKVNVYLQ